MDITTVFGTVIPGSSPGGSTKKSMIDHIHRPVRDYAQSKKFYEQVLAPLGYKLLVDRPEQKKAGFGTEDKNGKRDFWIIENPGEVQGGNHCIAFKATNKEMVDAFHIAGLAAGGKDNGKPGYRAEYSPGYYAAFISDPDGYNVEAIFDDE